MKKKRVREAHLKLKTILHTVLYTSKLLQGVPASVIELF